jgi:hypothetical protein
VLILILFIALAALLGLYVLGVNHAKRKGPPRRAGIAQAATASGKSSELLALHALIFEFVDGSEDDRSGLCLRILDEMGNEVGYVADERPRSRLAFLLPRRIGIYDRKDVKVIEFVTPAQSERVVDITDGAGHPVGSIDPEDREGRRFILRDASRRNAARFEWEPGRGREVRWNAVVGDSWGREIGRITRPRNLGATDRLLGRRRAGASGSGGWRGRARDYLTAADAYVLLMRGSCDRTQRLLMLGAAVYLEPTTDNGDGP